jgi:hypothetical protein
MKGGEYGLVLSHLPRVPRVGDGRTNASGLLAKSSIRVLSPSILPPVRDDEGSLDSTNEYN